MVMEGVPLLKAFSFNKRTSDSDVTISLIKSRLFEQ
ncbi:hypothetical protein TcasGA2_TC032679 [Tribolium castaneum]|uniref:Uncharacterized protein n=1 Tax=Tribolium castaneum TaxID=7070 RepID=A0A139WJN9_TRICA|nr:hypothetical protein TcasGA2_TC032679 [Tribolium castaneum]